MAQTNFNTTYPGSAGGQNTVSTTQISIPSSAFNIQLVVAGGAGGNGGNDQGGPGRPGAAGRAGTFTLPNYTARTLTLSPGGSGQNRPNQCGNCFSNGGQTPIGAGDGGRGGTTGGSGSSGAGGGGGAASIVYDSLSASDIIIAGGGGGGGGGSLNCEAGSGGTSAKEWTAFSGSMSRASGSNGGGPGQLDPPIGDGGSGGGGGGGIGGGGGTSGSASWVDQGQVGGYWYNSGGWYLVLPNGNLIGPLSVAIYYVDSTNRYVPGIQSGLVEDGIPAYANNLQILIGPGPAGAGAGGTGGVDNCGYLGSDGFDGYIFIEVLSTGGQGGGSGYRSNYATLTAQSTNGGNGYITLSYTAISPEISSFTANPINQNSSGGIPLYTTQLQWSTVDVTSLTITSSTGETYNVTGTSNLNITNLPQSNANGTTPATRTYTLTACYNTVCTSTKTDGTLATVTVNARNDNSPTTTWTQTFSNLEPDQTIQVSLGTLQGVDMPTAASTSGDGNFVGTGLNGTYSGSRLFNSGEQVWLKFNSLPYNTDVSGVTGIYGKTNTKTISVTIGTQTFNVTATTKAPRISEDFNYSDNKDQYPYVDIDMVTNTPTQYLNSASITADDVEIPVEIKSNDGGLQVNINNTGWQNVRSI